MTFQDACKKLDIEDYADRIWRSNSYGELSHLSYYIQLAESDEDLSWFRPLFLECVSFVHRTWKRPESVYQHMDKMIPDLIKVVTQPQPV